MASEHTNLLIIKVVRESDLWLLYPWEPLTLRRFVVLLERENSRNIYILSCQVMKGWVLSSLLTNDFNKCSDDSSLRALEH